MRCHGQIAASEVMTEHDYGTAPKPGMSVFWNVRLPPHDDDYQYPSETKYLVLLIYQPFTTTTMWKAPTQLQTLSFISHLIKHKGGYWAMKTITCSSEFQTTSSMQVTDKIWVRCVISFYHLTYRCTGCCCCTHTAVRRRNYGTDNRACTADGLMGKVYQIWKSNTEPLSRSIRGYW